ncbi:MAG: hypothetical protein V1909_05890 [Candidatus Micrarchaeota archaeon]
MKLNFGIACIASLLLIFLINGCTSGYSGASVTSDEANAQTFTLNGSGTNASIGRLNCTVMFCKTHSTLGWLNGWWFSIFGTYLTESTLYGGTCRFQSMTPVQIEKFLNDSLHDGSVNLSSIILLPSQVGPNRDYVRPFMYGQGSTFAEFDEANAYCLNNLSMAVKWMKWDPTQPGLAPHVATTLWEAGFQRGRARCYLKANVLPVYIFYTNSTLSAMSTGDIGTFAANFRETSGSLSGQEMGPVVISPEFAYKNTPAVIARVKDMIRAIRVNCQKCLIMLSPPEEDMESLKAILDDPTNNYEMNRTVDIIGQSWTLNRDETCSLYQSISRKLNFSQSILARYNKPTLWAYLAASNSSNALNTCKWTEKDIADAFDMIYINTPGLVAAGGIGLGHFQLLDGIDATYECRGANCSLGLLNSYEVQKQPMFNRWFKRCNGYYYTELNAAGKVLTIRRTPIVFNFFGDNGTECNVIPNLGPYQMIRVSTDPEPTGPDMVKPREVYNCDRCFGRMTTLTTPVLGYPLALPSVWYGSIYFNDLHLALGWHNTLTPIRCDPYYLTIRKQSEIACQWEMDPLFVRAVANHDSELQRCSIEYGRASDSFCNPSNIPNIVDAASGCSFPNPILHWNPIARKCEEDLSQPGWALWENCKPCTYGLMKCTQLPSNYQSYSASGPFGCGNPFNPFDPQMGVCCGTNELCNDMTLAVNWVFDNPTRRSDLSLNIINKPNWAYDARSKWTVLLVALIIYKNHGDMTQLDADYLHWRKTKWCPGSVAVANAEGPAKTYVWDYCGAYNESGSVWQAPAFPDPFAQCLAETTNWFDCHLGCCGDPSVVGSGSWPTAIGQSVLPSTINWNRFDTTYSDLGECLTDPECCDSLASIPPSADPVCPDKYNYWDPSTYRCNRQGNCCGGSFMEHMCCRDPYACEVLFEYNKTINTCPGGNFCARDQ